MKALSHLTRKRNQKKMGWDRSRERELLSTHHLPQMLAEVGKTLFIAPLSPEYSKQVTYSFVTSSNHLHLSSRGRYYQHNVLRGNSGLKKPNTATKIGDKVRLVSQLTAVPRLPVIPGCCYQQESAESLNSQRRLILAALRGCLRKSERASTAVSENISALRFEDPGVL